MRSLPRLAALGLALSSGLARGANEADHVDDDLAALADSDRAACECE
jgi:hypothetical protein